ncbi:MAG: hypothetical protein M1816_003425 [Peltula sp. TS41687]|nr:MAG: hypothetical protein M1816_003425 [Peltula sp. TS41687]
MTAQGTTNIPQESPRNELSTSAWIDETQLGGSYDTVQFGGLDATNVLHWPDSSHLADDILANRSCQLSSADREIEQSRTIEESPHIPWDVWTSHETLSGPQLFPGCDAGVNPSNGMMSGVPDASSWPSEGYFTTRSGSQLYSHGLPACSPEVAFMDRQAKDARTYSRPNKELSQRWSQAANSLDGGSCDEVFSDMSPRTAYSNGSNCVMRKDTTKPAIWCQAQGHDGLPLDLWWEDGGDATTVWSPNGAFPEMSRDEMELSPLGSTWLDDLFLSDDNLTCSGAGNLLLSSFGDNHDPTLPVTAGGLQSTAEGSLELSIPPYKDQTYGSTADRWTSLMEEKLNHHQPTGDVIHDVQSMEEPSRTRRMYQPPQRPGLPRIQRPPRRKQSPQSSDHRSGSSTPRASSTKQTIQRIRTQPKPRCAPRPDAKDVFLVQSKLAGMSYREIRDRGNFSEAESTLRGRFRTLTKDKENRVRKPEWQERDVHLLVEAVGQIEGKMMLQSSTCQSGKNSNKGVNRDLKIPWKQVAEYIAKNGGSYHFGNATCRKKYDEIRRTMNGKDGCDDDSKGTFGGQVGDC